jgi:hypothetical protein
MKETLEESFDRIYNSVDFTEFDFASFKLGAKWQQERMYSEEEVETIAKDAYVMGRRNVLISAFKYWFEQFKKK